MRRLEHMVAAFACVVITSSTALAQPAQVRVVWTEEPARKAIVSWTTNNTTPGQVVWAAEPHQVASEYGSRTVSKPTEVDDERQVVHHATLTHLEPNSIVHFRVVADAAVSRPYWFKTAPEDATPFALLYGGDSRSGAQMRRAMNSRIHDLVAENPAILALVHGGDFIMTGSSWSQWNRWLEDWQLSIGDDGRVLPIIPTRGNHEGNGRLFNVVFGFPGTPDASGDWFVTRLGQDFALVTLDSNVSLSGEQRSWLGATLLGLQNTRWIAASYHRPAYPAVKSPGDALTHWVPLFEQYNVDMVLESDGHALKRTVPIRADQPDPTGVVYLGEGGLGVPQRTPDATRWYLQPPGMTMAAHHIQLLRVTPDKIFYEAIDAEGEILDRYEFEPKRLGQAATEAASITALPVREPSSPRPASGCASPGGGLLGFLLPIALRATRRRQFE